MKMYDAGLCNYYGCVSVGEWKGNHYLGLENYTGWKLKPISKELYHAILSELCDPGGFDEIAETEIPVEYR